MNSLRNAHPNYDDATMNRVPWSVPVPNRDLDVKVVLRCDGTVSAFRYYENNRSGSTWVSLGDALYFNFEKTIAPCRHKRLPSQCIDSTPEYRYTFLIRMTAMVKDYINTVIADKGGVSRSMQKNLEVIREAAMNLKCGNEETIKKTETQIRKVFANLNLKYDPTFTNTYGSEFDPTFVEGEGIRSTLIQDWFKQNGYYEDDGTGGSEGNSEASESDEASECEDGEEEMPDSKTEGSSERYRDSEEESLPSVADGGDEEEVLLECVFNKPIKGGRIFVKLDSNDNE